MATAGCTPPLPLRIALSCLCLVGSLLGQAWTWKNVNLQGMGYVTGLIVHPNPSLAPHAVYARTDVGGAYRYHAADDSWTQLLDDVGPLNTAARLVESIAIDPTSADIVYVAPGGGRGVLYGKAGTAPIRRPSRQAAGVQAIRKSRHGEVAISVQKGKYSTLQVLDLRGRTVISTSVDRDTDCIRLSLRSLPSGRCVVQLRTPEGQHDREPVVNW